MRKLLITCLLGTLVLAAPAAAKPKSVKIGDNWFVRPSGVPTVTVERNDTVRWNWTGDSVHNVVASGPASFRSGTKSSGSYRRKVTKRGTYTIVCTIHGRSDQSMKLVVK